MFSVSPFRTAAGAVVGLQNVPEIVVVDREEARVGRVIAMPPFFRVCRIGERRCGSSPSHPSEKRRALAWPLPG